jgi:hypothetical protein
MMNSEVRQPLIQDAIMEISLKSGKIHNKSHEHQQ